MVSHKAFAAALVALTLTPCFVRPAAAKVTRPRDSTSRLRPRRRRQRPGRPPRHRFGPTERVATAPESEKRRPSIVMMSLYSATALVQGLDAHSTLKAINAGATERNPLMHALTAHPPVFVALKAGAAAGLIFAGQRPREAQQDARGDRARRDFRLHLRVHRRATTTGSPPGCADRARAKETPRVFFA